MNEDSSYAWQRRLLSWQQQCVSTTTSVVQTVTSRPGWLHFTRRPNSSVPVETPSCMEGNLTPPCAEVCWLFFWGTSVERNTVLMVVLESKGMLTAGSNQYLQPDYLSPLPTTVSNILWDFKILGLSLLSDILWFRLNSKIYRVYFFLIRHLFHVAQVKKVYLLVISFVLSCVLTSLVSKNIFLVLRKKSL